MLEVLLCITSGVLQPVPPENKMKTLGGKLAQAIFQVSNDIHGCVRF